MTQPTRQEVFNSLKARALEHQFKDDYAGIFSVAQVLWLIEEIERKDQLLKALIKVEFTTLDD